jgi:hypothetical protein
MVEHLYIVAQFLQESIPSVWESGQGAFVYLFNYNRPTNALSSNVNEGVSSRTKQCVVDKSYETV